MTEENSYDSQRGSERTNDRTIAVYDRTRGELEGVAVFTKPTTIKSVEAFTGKAVTFIVETARQAVTEGNNQQGDTIFVESMSEAGLVRMALPPKVANAIARQRDALSARARSKAAKLLAKERKERGELPGFMRNPDWKTRRAKKQQKGAGQT